MKSICIVACAVMGSAWALGGEWPKGLDPQTVGTRVVRQFLSTEPDSYAARGFTAGNYGGGKVVVYSVVSLWVNALEFARRTGNGELEQECVAKFHPFLPGGAKADRVSKPRHVDFNVFGAVPLEVAILTGDGEARAMGLRYADDQWAPPRADDLAAFPKWLVGNYQEPPRQRQYLRDGYSGQTRLWIDDMYMINLLQTQAYRVTADRTYIDRAAKEMVLYLDKLQLESGLFNHAVDVPYRWGRGNGWMAAGMPMILQYLKPGDAHYDRILAGYRKMMAKLLETQRANGLWGQLVDDPSSWDETSGSLMFAYGFLMGSRHGWLDAATYGPAARKAYLAVVTRLDADANVPDVCCGTGARNDRQYYFDRERINGDPHGQAPLLWCVNELLASSSLQPGGVPGVYETPPPGFRFVWQKPPLPLEERRRRVAAVAPDELRLEPTFCSCSVVWGGPCNPGELVVEYRPEGGVWKQGSRPVWFGACGNWRSSILNLAEDTVHEMRLTANGKTVATGSFRTWKGDVPVARTIAVDPAKVKYPIVISEKGTPEGWIRYTAKSPVGGTNLFNSVFLVKDAAYVLLDDMEIVGGGAMGDCAVTVRDSRGVRVRNCEIHTFGRTGRTEFSAEAGGKLRCEAAPGKKARLLNWDAGIMLESGSEEVVVERCYIHDPRASANSWYYSHPAGPEGIMAVRRGRSTVIRYNDIVGSDGHWWNDAIESGDNFSPDGGLNRDADVYGNFAIFANDDIIELDGGQQNVRCFGNRFETAVSAVSIQGCATSPVYLYDNLLGPCGDRFGLRNDTIKTSGMDAHWYAPYACLSGNVIVSAKPLQPHLGPTTRFDLRPDNRYVDRPSAEDSARYPVRDLPFALDRGRIDGIRVSGTASAPASVTVVATARRAQPFRIRRNFDADWFDVAPREGALKPGKTVFTVTFRPEKMVGRRLWRAAFLVRTPEGLSRAVSVEAERTDYEPPRRPVPAGRNAAYCDRRVTVGPDGKTDGPLEFAVDVAESGPQWAFLRVRRLGEGTPKVRLSVDGREPAKSELRAAPSAYGLWHLLQLRDESGKTARTAPVDLKSGHHVFRLQPAAGAPFEIMGFVLTNRPESFEP